MKLFSKIYISVLSIIIIQLISSRIYAHNLIVSSLTQNTNNQLYCPPTEALSAFFDNKIELLNMNGWTSLPHYVVDMDNLITNASFEYSAQLTENSNNNYILQVRVSEGPYLFAAPNPVTMNIPFKESNNFQMYTITFTAVGKGGICYYAVCPISINEYISNLSR